MKNNRLFALYQELYRKYGAPSDQWQLWCKRPKTKAEKEEVVIGAILTQRTNWKNVSLSIRQLKKEKLLSLDALYKLSQKKSGKLRQAIRSSGFYKTKSRYLAAMAVFFKKKGGIKNVSKFSREALRATLLDLPGVGPETADSILLYALDKPIFVIDEYTRRLWQKKFRDKNLSYDHLQKKFENDLQENDKNCVYGNRGAGTEKTIALYQDFHALIVIDGKNQKTGKN